MVELKPDEIQVFDIDATALRVFLKALEILGGPRKLIEYRNLTWITSLMEASYAIVLSREGMKTEDWIAQFLGLTRQTVRNILRADPELVLKKLEGELQEKTPRAHTAGGLAKLAYNEIKEGRDSILILTHIMSQTSEALGIIWPVEVLRRTKGMSFPVERQELAERLSGMKIKDKPIETLLDRLSYPVRNPAELLKGLREAMSE
ncbi:MAG: bacterio-opsin activator [Candidatus Hydrothermota bacterium]|nr:MAG: bacterio-opsin activator [Candidatus Hydrothermae bacterium]